MDSESATRAVSLLAEADREFNQWMGLRILSVEPGQVSLGMTVAPHMANSQEFCHGGMLFSLADSACAYAVASGNVNPATTDAAISYLAPARVGDALVAVARLIHRGRKLTRCTVEISTDSGDPLAVYQASCFHRGEVVSARQDKDGSLPDAGG